MTRSARRRRAARPTGLLLLPAFLLLAGAAILGAVFFWPSSPADPVPWASLGTQDVHSLSFVDGTDRLLFGHHGGLLESADGGRTWQSLPARADAMSLAVDGPSIVIAGHNVFQESANGGRTWADVPADLPNLDIHAFARGIADPTSMWAYLAEGGVYESTDAGRHWQRVHDDHVQQLTTVLADGRDVLLGIQPLIGLVRSDDGGRSWDPLSEPPVAPVTTLAATASGQTLLIGGPRGLFRSDNGGDSWEQIFDRGTVLALAVSADGQTVAAVTSDTRYYRSDDGGNSWPGP